MSLFLRARFTQDTGMKHWMAPFHRHCSADVQRTDRLLPLRGRSLVSMIGMDMSYSVSCWLRRLLGHYGVYVFSMLLLIECVWSAPMVLEWYDEPNTYVAVWFLGHRQGTRFGDG